MGRAVIPKRDQRARCSRGRLPCRRARRSCGRSPALPCLAQSRHLGHPLRDRAHSHCGPMFAFSLNPETQKGTRSAKCMQGPRRPSRALNGGHTLCGAPPFNQAKASKCTACNAYTPQRIASCWCGRDLISLWRLLEYQELSLWYTAPPKFLPREQPGVLTLVPCASARGDHMASGSSSFFKRCLCSGSASEMHTRTAPLITLTPNSLRISESPKVRHEVGFKANQLGVSISATASNKD